MTALGVAVAAALAIPRMSTDSGGGVMLARGLGLPSTTDATIVIEQEAPAVPADLATTTVPPATVPPTTLPPTTAPPPPPPPPAAAATPQGVEAVMAAAAAGVGTPFTMEPYSGMGTWLDVYDWSATFTGGRPPAGMGDIDRMAALGVQTLYIQASKWNSPTGNILEPDRLIPLIQRARSLGIRVVGWYLPTLENLRWDFEILKAIAALPLDGLAVDIEARNVADVNERNRLLVQLSGALRNALPGRVIGAIPIEPVVLDLVNPRYWPNFPWTQLAPLYDVWLPMSYWTNRTEASGYNDGYKYTADNIDRLRWRLGLPQAPVHTIGGIGTEVSPEDVDGMIRAATERYVLGGSFYDYRITSDAVWQRLQQFRR